MKIALSVQYNSSFAEIAALTVPVMQSYALRHGYSLFVHKCEQESPEIVWQRLKDITKLLPDFDTVVHLDADILITNPEVKIETLMATSGASCMCGTDWNGLNDGFCLWRKSWEAQELLKHLMAMKDVGGFTSPQHAMGRRRGEDVLYEIPQRAANSYLTTEYGELREEGQWQSGDFILHLPGLSNARRIEILKEHTS